MYAVSQRAKAMIVPRIPRSPDIQPRARRTQNATCAIHPATAGEPITALVSYLVTCPCSAGFAENGIQARTWRDEQEVGKAIAVRFYAAGSCAVLPCSKVRRMRPEAVFGWLQPTPGYMWLVKDRIIHVWSNGRVSGPTR